MITYPERNKRIHAERIAGLSFKAISERYGLTAERVRQIYLREERRRKRYEEARIYGGRHYTRLLVDRLETEARILSLDIRLRKFDSQPEDTELLSKLNNLIEIYKEV